MALEGPQRVMFRRLCNYVAQQNIDVEFSTIRNRVPPQLARGTPLIYILAFAMGIYLSPLPIAQAPMRILSSRLAPVRRPDAPTPLPQPPPCITGKRKPPVGANEESVLPLNPRKKRRSQNDNPIGEDEGMDPISEQVKEDEREEESDPVQEQEEDPRED